MYSLPFATDRPARIPLVMKPWCGFLSQFERQIRRNPFHPRILTRGGRTRGRGRGGSGQGRWRGSAERSNLRRRRKEDKGRRDGGEEEGEKGRVRRERTRTPVVPVEVARGGRRRRSREPRGSRRPSAPRDDQSDAAQFTSDHADVSVTRDTTKRAGGGHCRLVGCVDIALAV